MQQTHLDDLIVLSWKLVDLGSDKFEEYTKNIVIPDQPLYDSVYLLKTCERILVAFLCPNQIDFSNYSQCSLCSSQKNCFNREIMNIFPSMISESQKYEGVDAFRYLCSVAGSLDSSTIGEHEILGQFKNALVDEQESKVLFGALYDILLFAFKTGKKIHSNSGIPKGRISILSNAEKIFHERFETVQEQKSKFISIAIIGTGKMGRDAYKYFENKFSCEISVYTRNRSDSTDNNTNIVYSSFEQFLVDLQNSKFDVILLCSSTNDPFITTDTVKNQNNLLIFDLGIPKNADPIIANESGISLYQMDQLVRLSEQNLAKRSESIAKAHEIIDAQVQMVGLFFEKKAIDPFIKDLRFDLEKVARKRLNDYTENKELPVEFYKWFNNTIKELMHVSQQHLEKGIHETDKAESEAESNSAPSFQLGHDLRSTQENNSL